MDKKLKEKNLGGPLLFFRISSRNFLFSFYRLMVGNVQGELQMMFTVIDCLFRRLTASKSGT